MIVSDKTQGQIAQLLSTSIHPKKLTQEDFNKMVANSFASKDVKLLLMDNYGLKQKDADELASTIEKMVQDDDPKATTQTPTVVVNPAQFAPVSESKKFVSWVVGTLLVVMAVLAVVLLWSNCLDNNNGKSAGAVVNQPETSNTELQAIKSRMDTVETNMSKLDTKVESVAGSAESLADAVTALQDKVNEGLGKKADKSALDNTNKRVTRLEKKVRKIERKLNAHIENEVQDPYPDLEPVLEPAEPELSLGKTIVMVCKGGRKCKRAK